MQDIICTEFYMKAQKGHYLLLVRFRCSPSPDCRSPSPHRRSPSPHRCSPSHTTVRPYIFCFAYITHNNGTIMANKYKRRCGCKSENCSCEVQIMSPTKANSSNHGNCSLSMYSTTTIYFFRFKCKINIRFSLAIELFDGMSITIIQFNVLLMHSQKAVSAPF